MRESTAERYRKVMRLHKEGVKDKDIAVRMSMHYQTVGRIIAKESVREGIPVRTSRPKEPGSARDLRRIKRERKFGEGWPFSSKHTGIEPRPPRQD